jgi:hypothetical protein
MRISRVVSAVIFGAIFSACGCIMGFIFGQQTVLTCTRPEPAQIECGMQKSWLGLVPLGKESLQNLEGARVDESCDEDGCTYRVELDTRGGFVPLTAYYSSGVKSKQEAADQINAFVQDPGEDSLEVKGSVGLLGILFPLVFVFVGPLIVVSAVFRAIRG